MTLLHIFANIRAVKSVCLRSFNESRYLIALEEFFKTGKMLSVAQVNKLERVTIGQTVSLSLQVKIGLSARNLTNLFKTSQDIENILSSFDPNENFIFAECRRYLGIYLHFDARPQEVLKAYFYAVSYLQDRNQFRDKYWEVHSKWNDFLTLAQKEGKFLFSVIFIFKIVKIYLCFFFISTGWNTLSHLLFVDEYRMDWKI